MDNAKRAATFPDPLPSKATPKDRGWSLLTATSPTGRRAQGRISLKQSRLEKTEDTASRAIQCPDLIWTGADLPHVSPGDYQAVCVDWQGPEWCVTYRRWSIRLELTLLSEGIAVSAFFNLGSNPEMPHIGRNSRFYAAWCKANGEHPRKGQQMTYSVFTEPGLLYLVRVADCVKDWKEADKPEELGYSRVTEILKIERP